MKKKILWLVLSLFLVPSVVLADSCDSENICSGEVSNSCSYREDINNSCHYECTENSKLGGLSIIKENYKKFLLILQLFVKKKHDTLFAVHYYNVYAL